ncbi:MAG: glycosyltransferase [Pirellulales bacterium]
MVADWKACCKIAVTSSTASSTASTRSTRNPATDEHLAKHYTAADFVAGKADNKFAVQTELALPTAAEIPMLAFVGRLADQKGVDLILEVLRERLVERNEQWVFLGTGDPRIEDRLRQLAREFPNKLSVTLAFSDALCHRIEAAADLFLMPSRFEPCGLSQLYSLRYGTVPIVRSTGGLVDTIVDVDETSLVGGTATGFRFDDYHPGVLSDTIDRALRAYAQPDVWRPLVTNGMLQDWSWSRSAREYAQLYESLRAKKLAVSA